MSIIFITFSMFFYTRGGSTPRVDTVPALQHYVTAVLFQWLVPIKLLLQVNRPLIFSHPSKGTLVY